MNDFLRAQALFADNITGDNTIADLSFITYDCRNIRLSDNHKSILLKSGTYILQVTIEYNISSTWLSEINKLKDILLRANVNELHLHNLILAHNQEHRIIDDPYLKGISIFKIKKDSEMRIELQASGADSRIISIPWQSPSSLFIQKID